MALSSEKSLDTGAGTIEDPELKRILGRDKESSLEVFGGADDIDELEADIAEVDKLIKKSKNPAGKGFWYVVPAIFREYIYKRKGEN